MKRWYALSIRTRLGIIAATLLVVAALSVVQIFAAPQEHAPLYGIIKWAPLLFLFWMAWPDLARIPRVVYYVLIPVAILCALKPMLLYLVVPVALVALFLMPKK